MPLITTNYDAAVCQCCGYEACGGVEYVCAAYSEWSLTEDGELACGYHKAELYIRTERKVMAMGVKPAETHDRYRNFR